MKEKTKGYLMIIPMVMLVIIWGYYLTKLVGVFEVMKITFSYMFAVSTVFLAVAGLIKILEE